MVTNGQISINSICQQGQLYVCSANRNRLVSTAFSLSLFLMKHWFPLSCACCHVQKWSQAQCAVTTVDNELWGEASPIYISTYNFTTSCTAHPGACLCFLLTAWFCLQCILCTKIALKCLVTYTIMTNQCHEYLITFQPCMTSIRLIVW